jgi:hypothetical protein
VSAIELICKAAMLASTQTAAERTKSFLSQVPLNEPFFLGMEMQETQCATMFRHLMDIISRIRDDCASRLYFQIAPENAEFLRETAQHFGPDVDQTFSEASEDISEAACCLALGRTTAVVFHLMRAMEVAVKRLGAKLNVTIVDKHNVDLEWGKILANIKVPIETMPRGEMRDKWSEAFALLFAACL